LGPLGEQSLFDEIFFYFYRLAAYYKMAEVATTYQGKSVKDVPADAFIKAFSSYLKSTGKVRFDIFSSIMGDKLWACESCSQSVG